MADERQIRSKDDIDLLYNLIMALVFFSITRDSSYTQTQKMETLRNRNISKKFA